MSLTKLVCPECSKVLKPARPVAPGKKVRCPKCDAVFVAGEEEDGEAGIALADDEEAKPKKKPAPAKAKAAKDKPDAKAKKPAASEEEEGAYVLSKDGDDDEKPDIEYAPNQSIKDLRGPAVAMLTSPTNL